MSPLPNFLPITEIPLYAQPWNLQLVLDSEPQKETCWFDPTDGETEAMIVLESQPVTKTGQVPRAHLVLFVLLPLTSVRNAFS